MASVTASWRAIEGVLCENAHSVFKGLRGPASEGRLKRLEVAVGRKLPRDLVQSLKIHDGLKNSFLGPVRLFNYWALLPVEAMLEVSQTMTSLQAECGLGGCQFKVKAPIKNDAHWRTGWVPILDADGDKLVVDLDPAPGGKVGQVFEWSNTGSFPMRLMAPSFEAWLADLAQRLSRRGFRLDEGGSIWIDDE